MDSRTTEELFLEFRRCGEPECLAEIFDRLATRLLRLAIHLVGDPVEAEDVVQATLVTAIEKREEYDASRPLLPWLIGILQLHARRARERRRVPDPDRIAKREVERPDLAAESSELRTEVRRAVEGLPRRYRTVLLLKLVHGLEPAEIAEALDQPPALVRVHVHRGLDLVRAALPRGIAVGALAAWYPTRGLAAIRAEVLRQLPVSPHVALPLASLGGILMKKTTVAAAAAAALTFAVVVAASGRAPLSPAPDPLAARARVAESPVDRPGAGMLATAESNGRPTDRSSPESAAAHAGSVRVAATTVGGEPVPGVGVSVWRTTGPSRLEPRPGIGPLRMARSC